MARWAPPPVLRCSLDQLEVDDPCPPKKPQRTSSSFQCGGSQPRQLIRALRWTTLVCWLSLRRVLLLPAALLVHLTVAPEKASAAAGEEIVVDAAVAALAASAAASAQAWVQTQTMRLMPGLNRMAAVPVPATPGSSMC